MIETVTHNGRVLAIIIPRDFQREGVHFVTPHDFSQQLAYMKHPQGKVIAPHLHQAVSREVHFTKEVLLIRSGRLRVDFYDHDRTYLESRVLSGGDVILLADGGHGFEALETIELIEVKQGPFAGEDDKVRFEGIRSAEAVVRKSSP